MADIGISAYGIYIPRYRLSRQTISGAMGWLSAGGSPGEKAVASYDEDSLTMAAAAAIDCLKGTNRARIGGLCFASTTFPYLEKESATIIATALDLSPTTRTVDMANSLKAGTGAILSACDSAKAGAGNVLVCGADVRMGKPGSAQEPVFGDAAAAFLIGDSGVIASLEGWYSASYDFSDYRRAVGDKFVRAAEERFIREVGYTRFIPEAISGLLKKYKLEAKDINKVAYPCLNFREHAKIGKKLGFQPEQIQEPLFGAIGETGVASPLTLLVAMLEGAKPGDNILLASYGNGAEALLFKVTEEITKVKDRAQLKKALDNKRDLASYEQYLTFRGILPIDRVGADGEVANTQLPMTWRERKLILALYGSKCKRCGTPQYPAQRICVNPDCGAVDEMEDYCFADKKGTVFSFTADNVAASIDPPLLYALIDFDGGGRFVFELTDCDKESVKIGMPVEMCLRRKYVDEPRGIHGYFWKAIPIS